MRLISSIICLIVLSTPVLAQYKPDLPLSKGVEIVVDTYDLKTRTFAVYSARFPCEGLSYIVPEALRAALPSVDLVQLKRDPKSMVGRQFVTAAELKTIMDPDVTKNHDAQYKTSALSKICSQ